MGCRRARDANVVRAADLPLRRFSRAAERLSKSFDAHHARERAKMQGCKRLREEGLGLYFVAPSATWKHVRYHPPSRFQVGMVRQGGEEGADFGQDVVQGHSASDGGSG
jgi:hypothetical protein